MKVKLLSIMAGPEGSHDVGAVLDLPKKQAEELIEGRFAVAFDPDEDEEAEHKRSVTPETTSAKHPHAEHTVSHEQHKAK
jgi:hypothetical protein